MNNGPLLILGTGDQASVYARTAEMCGIPVAGYLGTTNRRAPKDRYVEGNSADRNAIAKTAKRLGTKICISSFGDNSMREQASLAALAAGCTLATLVHPTALIDDSVVIEDGVFIAQGVQIACGALLSRGALINTGAIIEHDCEIGSFAAVFSGSVLGGAVTVGPRAALGLGTTVLPYRKIGEDCIVGAGAVITRDQPALTVVTGAPGKIVRSRERDEPYVS
jgi:UDP-N-acetylbacillosamine N-acetyltransferase